MNIREYYTELNSSSIGLKAIYYIDKDCWIYVRIEEVRTSKKFGITVRTFKICPLQGDGYIWVDRSQLTILSEIA